MNIDIRTYNNNIAKEVRFGDKKGGLGRVCSIQRVVPVQFTLLSLEGNSVGHVKYEDIDDFIKALKYAKEYWGEELQFQK